MPEGTTSPARAAARDGALSHAAIVARESESHAIIGASGARQATVDGREILMDRKEGVATLSSTSDTRAAASRSAHALRPASLPC
ncbi:PEP-utilizing enzyme [Sorangium sp. So ce375]|uniref:PEP-utilizing enzyme n=1 Tax=Sorangium sp. So ce375 TaxID=3133306 RepID=UPI003F5C9D26